MDLFEIWTEKLAHVCPMCRNGDWDMCESSEWVDVGDRVSLSINEHPIFILNFLRKLMVYIVKHF